MGKFQDRDNEGEDNRFKLLHLILFRLLSLLITHIAVRSITLLPLPIPRHRTRLKFRPLTLPLPPALHLALHPPILITAPHNAQVRYPSHRLSHPKWLLPTHYHNNFLHKCIHHTGCRFQFLCLLWLNIQVDMGMQVGCMDNSSLDTI